MFQILLSDWYLQNKRDLPWRNTRDPYLIWLSEVMLQQTRVNQGLPYFIRFSERFPSVIDLASAPEDTILKLWQGLGYYSRARNMHETAKEVVNNHGGSFPESYSKLIQLKGIGPYTAAAIASFAFNEPVSVVDGNVFRVLSRFYGIGTPINSSAGKKIFAEKAGQFLNQFDPATHNQAVMELGSLVCTPKSPQCFNCPIAEGCIAFLHGKQLEFPVKDPKKQVVIRRIACFYIEVNGKIALLKRPLGDIWANLYDLPSLETEGSLPENWRNKLLISGKNVGLEKLYFRTHLLSHRKIEATYYKVTGKIQGGENFWKWIEVSQLSKYPVSRLLHHFFEDIIWKSGETNL